MKDILVLPLFLIFLLEFDQKVTFRRLATQDQLLNYASAIISLTFGNSSV